MRVEIVPCLKDNYAYLACADGQGRCVVVDPSEAEPVEQALRDHDLELVAILNTHHHHDHVGGNAALLKAHPHVEVFGYASDRGRIPAQTRFLEDGESFEVATLSFRVMHIPGHTLGAIAYVADDVAFTGDTLFAAGCGRLFEGTPQDMFTSLNRRLATLPAATRVFCGHEYTVNNLRFAQTLEPGNAAIAAKLERALELRSRGEPTVPTTLLEERDTNPFLRTESNELRTSLGLDAAADPVVVLGRTRAAKDRF